ncbi:NACHT domain-containing protein [Streptomyces sp. NBC_01803]|uniref:NACHT domain-containing protein n=1 Tax=Streptomyces sp. NBC_01803 TaxID=2975946 RepID=UPI002DDAB7E2|nr:NACHT domain-containing protein [Streptomyces sp. NBC_01803]WSA45633.1 NACHT domain-containing protein [Streptomyces sp. NBC_01803]
MELTGAGLRLASSAFTPLIKRLFRQDGPGAALVDKPVRIAALVSFGGEKRSLTERDLRTLCDALVRRAVREIGPHDAPSEDELIEATGLLARSLLRLGELDMDDIQAVRLGHRTWARQLMIPLGHGRPWELDSSSMPAHALYARVLESTCLHILNFFTQRSTFVARTLVEQSRDLDRLIRTVDLLIERVPHQSVEDAAFETRYADYVRREQGRLAVYGLDLRQAREWPLDDAYLSLETHHTSGAADAPPQRAEQALSGHSRVLLRGHAGSGKTTLVQWLAVATARRDPGDGLTHLIGRVPFVLPMRTLTRDRRRLPDPDGFLAAVDCPLAAGQPERWAHRVLTAKRGLLLVDGIDEIPEAEREEVRRWLRRLAASYPGNLWLVTARPSAVAEDWLRAEQFTELSLAPMSPTDVAAFVHRWHGAVGATREEAGTLLDLVGARADLATLATNPLMCALICALHRERNGYLPRGRKALYDAALAMLLERRDRERPDPPRGGVELDAETQISLLQKLAYWLITNGRSEMTASLATTLIDNALPALHRGDRLGPAQAVLRHLIERSGVVREPVPGAIDFVHRTFQDYLGAREIVEWQHFPALVEKAHEDQWEDVVRMAVAHAQPIQRGELLTDLIERGDRDPGHRVRLHLLATACLEHASQLRPEIRAAVVSRAERYIPPRVRAEAVKLAEIGSVALDLLPGPDELTDAEALEVVFTAARVGTDAALIKLRAFRHHSSTLVRHLLAVSWYRFDTTRYFTEIVSHLPRDDADLTFPATTGEELGYLGTLTGLARADLRGDFTAEDILSALADRPLVSLSLRDCATIGDLDFVGRLPGLRSLLLDNCPHIPDLAPLAGTSVRVLNLYPRTEGWEPEGLPGLDGLEGLIIGSPGRLDSLLDLPQRAPLKSLGLPSHVPDLTGIRTWPGLTELAVHHTDRALAREEWHAIAGLPSLRNLLLHERVLSDLTSTDADFPTVERLLLFRNAQEERRFSADLDILPTVFPGLRTLALSHGSEDFSPLSGLPELRSVQVHQPSAGPGLPSHVQFTAPPAPRY